MTRPSHLGAYQETIWWQFDAIWYTQELVKITYPGFHGLGARSNRSGEVKVISKSYIVTNEGAIMFGNTPTPKAHQEKPRSQWPIIDQDYYEYSTSVCTLR